MDNEFWEHAGIRSPQKMPLIDHSLGALTTRPHRRAVPRSMMNLNARMILPIFMFVALGLSIFSIGLTGAPVGSEFQVNTWTDDYQDTPAAAMDPSGNFVIAWNSNLQDGNAYGVYAQRYSSAGLALGSEFRVNTHTDGNEMNPSVGRDSDGDFVVVWQSNQDTDNSFGIYKQSFDSDGNAVGSETRVNAYITDSQSDPAIAMESGGRYLIVWTSAGQDSSGNGVFGQYYASTGVKSGSEFRVNTYSTNDQDSPAVAMDSNENAIVVWRSLLQDGASGGVYGQRYDSTGSPNGSEFRVNNYTVSNQYQPAVAMNSTGAFVVIWTSSNQDGSLAGVFGQRYNSTGSLNGTEFQVNNYTVSNQYQPAVAMDSTGAFVVVWTSYGQDGSFGGIYGQKFNPNGTRLEEEFLVNTNTPEAQMLPCIAMDTNGDFVVAWESDGQEASGSGWGIYGQLYDTTAIPEFGSLLSVVAGVSALVVLVSRKRKK